MLFLSLIYFKFHFRCFDVVLKSFVSNLLKVSGTLFVFIRHWSQTNRIRAYRIGQSFQIFKLKVSPASKLQTQYSFEICPQTGPWDQLHESVVVKLERVLSRLPSPNQVFIHINFKQMMHLCTQGTLSWQAWAHLHQVQNRYFTLTANVENVKYRSVYIHFALFLLLDQKLLHSYPVLITHHIVGIF